MLFLVLVEGLAISIMGNHLAAYVLFCSQVKGGNYLYFRVAASRTRICCFFFFFQTVEMSLHMAGFISFSSGKTHTQKSHYAGELALGEGQRERKMFLCIAFSSYHQARAQCC